MEKAVYSPINLSILSKLSKRILWVFLGFVLFFGGTHVASAASLYFSPSFGSHTIGTTFAVSVYVSSTDQALNAVSGTVSFPANRLEVVSISKDGSIINFWVTEPSISNSLGTINFEGVVLNPGYKGANGKIISIIFKAKAAGENSLSFSVSSVLANDGKGTNILTGIGNAKFICNNPISSANQPAESTTPALVSGTPLAPRISSPTHPLPEKWYNVSNPRFAWQLAGDITAVRLLYDKNPNSLPRVLYETPIDQKQLENLNDGIYYFHVQLKNKNGWGEVSHFRFQIDTTPPEPFKIKFIDEKNGGQKTISAKAEDRTSGINHYKIKISGGDFFSVNPEEIQKAYVLPTQMSGKHMLIVQAVDKAGNYSVDTAEFEVSALSAPTISILSQELSEGEPLKIKGNAVPNATIEVFLEQDGEVFSQSTVSGGDGNFSFIWPEKLEKGIYKIWVEAVDASGARTDKSLASAIAVKESGASKMASFILNYFTLAISTLVTISALLFLGWYLCFRLNLFRRRVRRRIKKTESDVAGDFSHLLENINGYLLVLEETKTKRELTAAEKHIAGQIKKDIERAQKEIYKELEEVEQKEKL